MKHIKEEYGSSCNLMESSLEEFYILKEFLIHHGIEARICSIHRENCVWQIRNGYKDWAHLYSKIQITGQKIIDIAEEGIRSKCYER